MAGEIATSKTFQDKMFERIRDSIGDLMPDEDLKKIVASGIEKAFFENRIVAYGSYGGTQTKEPVLVEMIRDLMREKIRLAVDSWMRDNPDKVKEAIEKVIQQGVFGCVMNQIQDWSMGPMSDLRSALMSKGLIT